MRVHLSSTRQRLLAVVITIFTLLLMLLPVAANAQGNNGFYVQTNLVSDIVGAPPQITDGDLVNPWGLVHGPATPWWVADNGAGVSTLYDGNGTPFPPPPPNQPPAPLVVIIPHPAGAAPGTLAEPNGLVFNGTSDFVVSMGG